MGEKQLDINTERGQISLSDERIMHEHIKKCWGVGIVETDKYVDPPLDGLLTLDNTIVGIFESKCRYNVDLKTLKIWNGWLITFDKLEKGKIVSQILKVPFYGFLYLVPDNKFFYWKITNHDGEYVASFDIDITPTKANTNGGSAIRPNAYLKFKKTNDSSLALYPEEILKTDNFDLISVRK